MARIEQVFEIFIASPNDVQQERHIVAKVIDEFVSIDGVGIDGIDDTSKGYSLRPVMWEDNPRDFNQTDTQAEINEILRRCDLTIAVFGAHLGTPTGRAPSGAIEEILVFDKELHLYLKRDSEKDLLGELSKHIEGMQNRTYYTYEGEEHLRRQVHAAIQRWYISTILNTILKARSSQGHDVEAVSQLPANNLERRSDAVAEASSADPVSSGAVSETPGTLARDAQQPTPSARQRTYIGGSVADLVRYGLLAAGARIIYQRAGETHTATVLASGDIQLSGGRTFKTPSAAGQAVGGSRDGWGAWRTEDGRTLRELRSQLQALGLQLSGQTLTRIRGSVADLVRYGLLAAGARIIYQRAGETHTATVLASGDIRLSGGRTFKTPSAAGQAVTGRQFSGWKDWRTEDGQTLHELRSQLPDGSGDRDVGPDAVAGSSSADPGSAGVVSEMPGTLTRDAQQPTPSSRQRTYIAGSVADLVRHGLLAAGARIICESRTGEQYTATVLASGDIQLSDGRTFNSPTPASEAVGGSRDGWKTWRTEDGRMLHELRSQLPGGSGDRDLGSDAVAGSSSADPLSAGAVSEMPGTPARDAQQPTPSSRQRTYIGGSVADLVRHGLLAAGARIICEPRPGELYVATVLASGDIQLSDGRTFNTPSAAGQAVGGRRNGWKTWRTEDGQTLHELRSQLQALGQQLTSGRRTQASFRGSVADLVRHGLLAAGARIICESRTGEQYTATVLASGDIQLSDGRTFNSPTPASEAVGGSRDGWKTWRTEDGQTLHELRSQLQK